MSDEELSTPRGFFSVSNETITENRPFSKKEEISLPIFRILILLPSPICFNR